jgi:plasmid stabilization system protein ParE
MSYPLVRHPTFEADLRRQVRWWARERSPAHAVTLLAAAEAECDRLARFPASVTR